MYPMTITKEEYAYHFQPGPDLILVERCSADIDRIGRIHLSQSMRENSVRFITVGKILAVSELESETEWVEYLKTNLRTCGYMGFSSHLIAECVLMPQFKLPPDTHIGLVHARDSIQFPRELDKLFARFDAYQKEMGGGIILKGE